MRFDESLWLIAATWDTIAGPVAGSTSPVSLKHGTLTIDVSDREAGEEVRGLRREIMKNCNSVLGTDAVLNVRWTIRRGTSHRVRAPLPPPDEETLEIASVIQDETIRELFIRVLCRHRARFGSL